MTEVRELAVPEFPKSCVMSILAGEESRVLAGLGSLRPARFRSAVWLREHKAGFKKLFFFFP